MRKSRALAGSLLAAAAAPTFAAAQTSAAITPHDARTRVEALAHDSMQGREAGTRGNVMATELIAAEALRLGLRPAGEDGSFFQTVPLVRKSVDPASAIAVGGARLAPMADFAPLPWVESFLEVREALALDGVPVVYGGRWGAPDALAPAEARGRLVVFDAPLGPGGRPAWQVWAVAPLDRYPEAAGVAIAALDVPGAEVLLGFIGEEQVMLRRERAAAKGSPAMLLRRAAAEALLGAPLEGLRPGAGGRAATGGYRYAETPMDEPARNVVAVLPGRDEGLRSQYVALGSHSDHDGVAERGVDHDSLRATNRLLRGAGADEPPREPAAPEAARLRALRDSLARARPERRDSVYNGADDDASGVAAMLEIAEHFAARPPRRSLLFVWHTAEEKGLLGSEHFTRNPTVPRDSIVAQLNLDMIGRGTAEDVQARTRGAGGLTGGAGYLQLVGSRRLSTALGDLVEEVNRSGGHGLRFDYSLDANGHPANIYCRSDHYNYARWGIPVTFFTTGLHPDYHMVTDEAEYLDYDKLAAVTRFVAGVAGALGERDAPPAVDRPKPDPEGMCQQ